MSNETATEKRCIDRVDAEWQSVREDLKALLEDRHDDFESMAEYGLSFDYVEDGTFEDQDGGFFRYQFSWGGPSDELRFYVDPEFRLIRAEYWFLDWFDGAHLDVTHDEVARQTWDWFEDLAPGIMQQ